MNESRAIHILQRYHERVRTALKRKRGNPPDVIEAVTFLRGGRVCEVCSMSESDTTKRIELHHKDGNWRNYTAQNLGFYCTDCHLTAHRGHWANTPTQITKYMSTNTTRRFQWKDAAAATLSTTVNEYVKDGASKRKAYIEISKKSIDIFGQPISPQALKEAYRKHKNKANGTVTTIVHMDTKYVSMDEMIKIVRLMDKYKITIA